MRAFVAFFKKELIENLRSGKMVLLLLLFCAFGALSPILTLITPWLLEAFGDSLSSGGLVINEITASALMSWGEFFESIGFALVAFVLICGGSFTREYGKGTLVLVLTKGLARYKVLLSKCLMMQILWSVGYWLCFGVTYGLNAAFWPNEAVSGIAPAAISWWLLGILAVSLTVFFSTIASNYGIVLLGVGGSFLAFYMISILPKVAKYLPVALMNSTALLVGSIKVEDLAPAIVITASLSIVSVAVSIPIFNKRQL